jgi:ATP-dependent Lhr-like helicase
MFPQQYAEDIGAHHSSLSKEMRFNIEQRLREGKLKVVVTSTSLELGIDIGYIDQIILLGSPKSISRALQRIGRAGHKLNEVAKGNMIVLDRDDLVECSVLLKDAKERKIDKIQIPKNCLDVLSQHIFGMAIAQKWNIDSLFHLIRKSYCYNSLTREDFDSVISYLSGEYALEARNVYAKIWFDPITREIGKRGKLARVIYMTNIGTIPDESFINVVLQDGQKIGFIDEGFLERLKPRDVFVLGGGRYEFLYTRGMNAYVKSSVHRQPTIPSWFSEMLPLSFDLAMSIQKFRKLVDEKLQAKRSKEEIVDFIMSYLYVDKTSANSIYDYFNEQFRFAKIPHLNRLLIEHFNDGGKHYVVFHSLFGRRVNDALSRALAFLTAQIQSRDLEIGISDNGFFLASLDKLPVEHALNMLNEKNIQEVLEQAIEKTEMFKRHFRHCASRSLMILRNYKGNRKSVGKQQMSSGFLLAAARKTSSEFPILKETKREILEDVMDVENARLILRAIKEKKIIIETIHTSLPSPFCLNLIIQGHADLMKMEDKLAFLKRMHKAIMEKIGK